MGCKSRDCFKEGKCVIWSTPIFGCDGQFDLTFMSSIFVQNVLKNFAEYSPWYFFTLFFFIIFSFIFFLYAPLLIFCCLYLLWCFRFLHSFFLIFFLSLSITFSKIWRKERKNLLLFGKEKAMCVLDNIRYAVSITFNLTYLIGKRITMNLQIHDYLHKETCYFLRY